MERLASLPAQLSRSVELVSEEDDPERQSLAKDGIGARIQAVYTGFEALIEATLMSMGVKIPAGESSHKDLPDTAQSHGLISEEEKDKLNDIRGFRHIHRHTYDITLDYELLKAHALSLAKLLPQILEKTETVLTKVQQQSEDQPGSIG